MRPEGLALHDHLDAGVIVSENWDTITDWASTAKDEVGDAHDGVEGSVSDPF